MSDMNPESLSEQQGELRRNQTDTLCKVSLSSNKVTIPPYCTCCMKPTASTETVSFSIPQKGASRNVSVDLPICPECLAHRKKAKRAIWLLLAISVFTALLSVILFSAFIPSAQPVFWILPLSVAAAVYVLLGFLLRLPKIGCEHSAGRRSAWINGIDLQTLTLQFFFTNRLYANLFAESNDTSVIEEPARSKSKRRSYLQSADHPIVIGALTLVFTVALLLMFGSNLAAVSKSILLPTSSAIPAYMTTSSKAVSSAPLSSAASSSKPTSSTSSSTSSLKASSKASSKAASSSKTAPSSKTSSVRSSSVASSEASSAVSSEITDENAERRQEIKALLATLKSEITDMEWKLNDYEARLKDLWARYTGSKKIEDLLAYARLDAEYDDYYEQYSWKVDYYNTQVELYNSLNSEG